MHNDVFEIFVKNYTKKAYTIAYGFFKNHYDAEDAVQEAFLQAYKSLHLFKGNAKIETWFYRILIRTCFKIQKQKKWFRWIWEDPDRLQIASSSELSITEDTLLKAQVRSAVQHLSQRQKMIFILRVYDEKPFSEIAEIIKISESTARVHYARALKKIKKATKDM